MSALSIKQFIFKNLTPHKCTRDSCGTNHNSHHDGCMELDSDIFVQACEKTELRHNGIPQAPNWQYHWRTWVKSWDMETWEFVDLAEREIDSSDPRYTEMDNSIQITLIRERKEWARCPGARARCTPGLEAKQNSPHAGYLAALSPQVINKKNKVRK